MTQVWKWEQSLAAVTRPVEGLPCSSAAPAGRGSLLRERPCRMRLEADASGPT